MIGVSLRRRVFRAGFQITKKRKALVFTAVILVVACAAIWFVVDRGLIEVERSARRALEDRLAQTYDVPAIVEGEAGVDLFPRLALVFSDVSIRVPDVEKPSLQIDRIEVPVRLQSLWQRSLTIETVVLIRPVIEFGQRSVPAKVEPPTITASGSEPRTYRETASASDFIDSAGNLGRVQIVDGSIRRANASPVISRANGTLVLTPNSASASLEGTAILNGDQTAVSISLDDPAGFAKGTDTKLRASASSETLTIRFAGKGSLRPGLFLDGAFEGSSARPQQVLDVFSGRQNNPARIPPISVRTHLVVEPR